MDWGWGEAFESRGEEEEKKVRKGEGERRLCFSHLLVCSPAAAAAEEGEVCPHVSSGRTSQARHWPSVGPAVSVCVCVCLRVSVCTMWPASTLDTSCSGWFNEKGWVAMTRADTVSFSHTHTRTHTLSDMPSRFPTATLLPSKITHACRNSHGSSGKLLGKYENGKEMAPPGCSNLSAFSCLCGIWERFKRMGQKKMLMCATMRYLPGLSAGQRVWQCFNDASACVKWFWAHGETRGRWPLWCHRACTHTHFLENAHTSTSACAHTPCHVDTCTLPYSSVLGSGSLGPPLVLWWLVLMSLPNDLARVER